MVKFNAEEACNIAFARRYRFPAVVAPTACRHKTLQENASMSKNQFLKMSKPTKRTMSLPWHARRINMA
jgi:hypothetical protein